MERIKINYETVQAVYIIYDEKHHYMDTLSPDTDIKLLLLRISSDYTYNKAIAIVPKEHEDHNWFSVDYKNCFKNWNEADVFLDGFCLAKNTNYNKVHER